MVGKPVEQCSGQDARHQALVVVVEDRLGNPAEESEGPVMTVQPSFRRRRRVGAHEASVAQRRLLRVRLPVGDGGSLAGRS